MKLLKSIKELLFPRYCCGCGRVLAMNERLVCPSCALNMPREMEKDAVLHPQFLAWHVDHPSLQRVGSYASFQRNNIVANMIHHLKYYHQYQLGDWMGRTAAMNMTESGFFEGVDFFVPMPITSAHYRKRGYNPSAMIAEGLFRVTGIPVLKDVLTRSHSADSQTHFSKEDRLARLAQIRSDLRINSAQMAMLKGKHIMLVDDVMTTGTTSLAAISLLETLPNIRISIFTWAKVR